MKFTVATFAAAVALLVAGAQADEPAIDEFWVAIMRLGSDRASQDMFTDHFLNQAAQNWSEKQPPSFVVLATADGTFGDCILGGQAFINPNLNGLETDILFETRPKGVSDKHYKEYQKQVKEFSDKGQNPYQQETVIDLAKAMYAGYFAKNPLDLKTFWASNADTMKQSFCTKEELLKRLEGSPHRVFNNVIKFEKVKLDEKQWKACVDDDYTPVCADPYSDEQEEINKACIACSINNGMVASALGAAALIAVGLFF